jgi:hypothetical protein
VGEARRWNRVVVRGGARHRQLAALSRRRGFGFVNESLDDRIVQIVESSMGSVSGALLTARLSEDGPTILAALIRLKEAGRVRLHFSALPVRIDLL